MLTTWQTGWASPPRTTSDPNLRHMIQFGIGMHHAGLKNESRKFVEKPFVERKIQVGPHPSRHG